MAMRRYADNSGHSGVLAYDMGEEYIDVQFVSGEVYRYSSRRPGAREVAHMKELALRGEGLSTFISRHIRNRYEAKWYSQRRPRGGSPGSARRSR